MISFDESSSKNAVIKFSTVQSLDTQGSPSKIYCALAGIFIAKYSAQEQ